MSGQNITGEKMARLRKKKGLTQAEFAQALGVSQRMVAAIEAGDRRPSVELAKKIGQKLGFWWTEFYEEEESHDAGVD